MLKKMYAFIFTLVLVAAAGCQSGDDEANSDPVIDEDVAKMVDSSLVADYGEEGSDLFDAYRLGSGNELDGEPQEKCGSHSHHRPKFGPFHNIVINSTWTYESCKGVLQDAYDPSDTGSILLVSDSSGTLTLHRMTKTFSRHAAITVCGLCGDNEDFTVSGNASSKSQMTFTAGKSGTVRNYSVETNTNFTDIVISTNWMTNPFPLSGTITYVMVIDKTVDGDPSTVITHVEKKVVITFNGTATPVIVIN